MHRGIKRVMVLCLCGAAALMTAGCRPKGEPEKPEPTPPVETQTITAEEAVGRLSSSVYSGGFAENEEVEGGIGLTDANAVGVDRERFENEVLYPVPEQGTAGVTYYDANDYGISVQNADNAAYLEILFNTVRAQEGTKVIYFPEGVYSFASTVDMIGLEGVYLAGDNAEWRMTEWLTAIRAQDCKDLHINGFVFDYDPASTVTGTVVRSDGSARTVTLSIEDEFDMTDGRFNGGAVNYGSYMEYVREEGGAYIPDKSGNLLYNSTGDGIKNIAGGSYDAASHELTLTFAASSGFRAPAVGTRASVSYTMYEYGMFLFEGCENVYMESNNVHTSLGMTFVTYNVNNFYMNRTNLMLREGSSRLMTSTADGLHANGCYGDMIVTNSIFEASHDDAMNICSFYNVVSSVSGRRLICSATSATTNYPIETGDVIEIYDPESMELVGSYTVKEAYGVGMTYDLTLDSRAPSGTEGYLVGNATRVPKLRVDNCIFRNKRNRGILAQVRESEIVNCTFENVLHGPVMMNASMDIFAEAIIPRDITVRNCKFFDNNSGHGLTADVSAFRSGGTVLTDTITGIVVENNFFCRSAGGAVYFCGTGNCIARNNLMADISRDARNSLERSAVGLNIDNASSVLNNFVWMSEALDGFQIVCAQSAEGTVQSGNGGHNV